MVLNFPHLLYSTKMNFNSFLLFVDVKRYTFISSIKEIISLIQEFLFIYNMMEIKYTYDKKIVIHFPSLHKKQLLFFYSNSDNSLFLNHSRVFNTSLRMHLHRSLSIWSTHSSIVSKDNVVLIFHGYRSIYVYTC